MVQERVAHLEAFKLPIEVTIFIGFECLVVADSVPVIFADDTNGGRSNRLSSTQMPRTIVLTALAVDNTFNHHISDLLRWFRKLWGCLGGVRQVEEQHEEEEGSYSKELSACHL